MNKNRLKAIFYVVLSTCLISAPSLWSAELRVMSAPVEVQTPGGAWTPASGRIKVVDGDTIRTGMGGGAQVTLSNGTRMVLRSRTTLSLNDTSPEQSRFNLLLGRLRAYVKKLKKGNKFQVMTPVAAASVRGTVFELEVGDDQSSRLSVLEGAVSYRDLADIGQEVMVLKGQSVLIEPGEAPRPAEPLPAEMKQGLVPDQRQQNALFSLKAEVQRETGLSAFKEVFQTDAVEEMKTAQYQEGKTLIDAFGRRVRLEEYIVRPSPNEFSFVSLNTRENRVDFTRFDLYAKNPLPEDIGSVDLFRKSGHDSMTNWVEKTNRLSSNGGDYYREWQEMGSPVNMNDSNGNQFQQVVFQNWYVEVKPEGEAPVLLSHWVPDLDYKNGIFDSTRDRDLIDSTGRDSNGTVFGTGDGAQDIPSGYDLFKTGRVQGDDRNIDSAGFTDAQRLDYFNNASVAASYRLSEGYSRTSGAYFDNKSFASASLLEILSATKVSRRSIYAVPGGSDITLTLDQYTVTDDGKRLNFLQAAQVGNDVESVNSEHVFSSSLTGNRSIDVIVSPSIFKRAGLLDN